LNVAAEQFGVAQNSLDPPPALSAEAAAARVEHLKHEADRHWYINPQHSLECADEIIAIGRARGDPWQMALGLMARGDALKFLGRNLEAWDVLEQAGRTFQAIGDDVGWARTRIGRLYAGLRLNRVAEALHDAEAAAAIFERNGETERLLRLKLQTADTYNCLRRYTEALALLQATLKLLQELGEPGRQFESVTLLNLGNTYHWQGQLDVAAAYYEQARAVASACGQTLNVALAESNLSMIWRDQGQSRSALLALQRALAAVTDDPAYTALFKKDLAECYLRLNRFAEARDAARDAAQELRARNNAYDLARTLLKLALAEAACGNLAAAQPALDEAEGLFDQLGIGPGAATARLWRGQLAFRQGDLAAARVWASRSAAELQAGGHLLEYAAALLLSGQIALAEGDMASARDCANGALAITRRNHLLPAGYAAHTLLGRAAEAQGQLRRAGRHYQAAMATVGRAQRHLTITLRPTFLEDKGQAQRALTALHLRAGDSAAAFDVLERAKAQALVAYLANREQLRWRDDGEQRSLLAELERLRLEHHWYYQLAFEPEWQREAASPLAPEAARLEAARCERRMKAITERLYLLAGEAPLKGAQPATRSEIQSHLGEATTLVAYFDDGEHLWAFVVTAHGLTAHRLPAASAQVYEWVEQLHGNVRGALQIEAADPKAQRLARLSRQILQRLHAALMAPLKLDEAPGQRLLIVPTGPLYLLPFHALMDDATYLIERYEVVILPAASWLCQPSPRRAPGARVLAHSWNGRLPGVLDEARQVQQWLGGDLFAEADAGRALLRRAPVQVLHIAAHGHHRLDEPELSYLQLADGQLYADDLFQQDLSYELVTLSACETGRSRVVVNDELIGLSRGFLYAGAGALILSLWPVADWAALRLMSPLYHELRRGASKAAAVRAAQLALLAEDPQRHPAHWAAFQLVGNPDPLHSTSL